MGDFYVCEEKITNPKKRSSGCGENRWRKLSEVGVDVVRTLKFCPENFPFDVAIDDFFTRLLTLTSYLRHRCIRFIEDLVSIDTDGFSQDSEVLFSGKDEKSLGRTYHSPSEKCSTSSKALDASSGLLICDRRGQNHAEYLSVNTSSEIVEIKHECWLGHSMLQRLLLPLFGFRLAWKLAFACFRCSFIHVRHTQIRVRSWCSGFISRAHKTLRGSSDDIGWLERTPGVPPVQDGTARFMELLHHIRNGEHALPNSFVYLFIPGLLSNHSPLYFLSTKKFFSKMGLACHIAKIHSEASVERNAWELKQYIEELYWGSGKRVLLLGHSKGGVDAAAALAIYPSDLKDKVAGLALVQSPYGGTPIASDILREGQIADKETRRIMELLICKLIKGDIRALDDLTYEKRKEFVIKHKLPEEVPIVSFHTEASVALGVLPTIYHIAHAELPWLPLPCFINDELDSGQVGPKVPVVIPLAAAMAICALHLRLRYGEKSDGLVTCRDAEVPGSVVVRPDQKLDHAWIVYSSGKKDTHDPDAFETCEALFTLLVEIGNANQEQVEG